MLLLIFIAALVLYGIRSWTRDVEKRLDRLEKDRK